jgi:hypothetical protein
MCLHDPDGTRGWNPECPAASRCLCGLFHPEYGQVLQPPPRRGSAMKTLAHIVIAIALVWLALCALVLGLVLLGDRREEQRS